MKDSEYSIEFNETEFFPKIFELLGTVVALVIIRSAYLRLYRTKELLPHLRRAIARGVVICMFFQDPRLEKNSTEAYIKEFDEVVALLRSIGVHVNVLPYIHHKIILLDDNACFTGSLNTSSWGGRTEENMTFWPNCKRKVEELKLKYRMDCCKQCAEFKQVDASLKSTGQFIATRRKKLRMTQADLAAKVGTTKGKISEFERGVRDPRYSLMLKIDLALNLVNRHVPNFMAPSLDQKIKKHLDGNHTQDSKVSLPGSLFD